MLQLDIQFMQQAASSLFLRELACQFQVILRRQNRPEVLEMGSEYLEVTFSQKASILWVLVMMPLWTQPDGESPFCHSVA